MRKLKLINNPYLFQGEKYINENKDYFEGWYFKFSNKVNSISFIPGISISDDNSKSFIQIITDEISYYVDYSIDDFDFSDDPFYIKIGDSYFSLNKVHVDIKDDDQNLMVYGDFDLFDSINIKTSKISPNIMGPFSYVPFMECNHAIINMKNKITGNVNFNNKNIDFINGIGYIEKDWGCSFPKYYIWCQGNNFKKSNSSFMLSIADIPFMSFNFKGLICSLIIDGDEFRFATYNNTKILKYKLQDTKFEVVLKKGNYLLQVDGLSDSSSCLIAPVNGKMKKEILESVSSLVKVVLKKDDEIIFSDVSSNCGLEIVD